MDLRKRVLGHDETCTNSIFYYLFPNVNFTIETVNFSRRPRTSRPYSTRTFPWDWSRSRIILLRRIPKKFTVELDDGVVCETAIIWFPSAIYFVVATSRTWRTIFTPRCLIPKAIAWLCPLRAFIQGSCKERSRKEHQNTRTIRQCLL